MTTAQSRPIRVGLLGADDTTCELVRAILANPQFQLAGAAELDDGIDPDAAGRVLERAGHVRRFQGWESLLDRDLVDMVIVARARHEDSRAEHLRKLIQTGIPVLVSHPVADSMLVYYELDMIRGDSGCVVVPYLPERLHPAIEALSHIVAKGAGSEIGQVEQVVTERRLERTDKAAVLASFARDVDVVRVIAGDMTRLGAMAGPSAVVSYAGLGVQMSGPSGIVARWSLDPQRGPQGLRLTVLGSQGKAVLEAPASSGQWTLHQTVGDKTEIQTYDGWNPADTMLSEFIRLVDGRPSRIDWVDAARDVELSETIGRSVEKGRTIELYYEDYTEQGTFKGLMASIGCGLLILGCLVPAVVGIADQIGVPYMNKWPYVLAGGLGIFLALQLLMLVFRGSEAIGRPPGKAGG